MLITQSFRQQNAKKREIRINEGEGVVGKMTFVPQSHHILQVFRFHQKRATGKTISSPF